MPAATIDIPLCEPPFPLEEYAARQAAVMEKTVEANLDALLVTANSHQQYLSGYDGEGSFFRPFPIVMVPGRDPTYVVRRYDEDAIAAQRVIADIVPYAQQADFAPTLASVLRTAGLGRGRIGLELDAWQLAPADVGRLQAELPEARFVDATRIVARVAAVKSPLELEAMRASMRATDAAIRAFWANIVEGTTETEAAEAVAAAIRGAGGESRGCVLLFGVRTALPHGAPRRYPLRRNQPAFTEVGGYSHGYAAGLCRSAVLGRHAGAEALHSLVEEALEAAIAATKPGALARDVDRAARRVFQDAGRTDVFRHRTGYQTGIAWSERGNLSVDPIEDEIIEEGMTLHYPIIAFQRGDYGVGASENLLVTQAGVELLSSTPHTLYRLD